jgi:hypothetical protein
MGKKDIALKNKVDKVKETITLLTKLKELGIPTSEPGYTETKKRCDEWINGTEAWSGRIDFPRFGRRAELILPARADRVSSMKLFAAT